MTEPRDPRADGQVRFLREVLEEQASIDLDVLEVATDTWVIHGAVPYDGETPLAVFASYEEAKVVLDQVCGIPVIDETDEP